MTTSIRTWTGSAIILALTVSGCGDDGGDTAGGPADTDSTSATDSVTGATTDDSDTGAPDTSDSQGDTTSGDASTDGDTGDADDTTDPPLPPGEVYDEDFEGRDGADWPDPWVPVGTNVLSSDLDAGRGRFDGGTEDVARMVLPGFSEENVEVTVTIAYEDYSSQGIGFYVRQNGGALEQTDPPGEGYAVYVEGGARQLFGVWRETDGVEVPIIQMPIDPPIDVMDQQPYRIRFQCFTEGAQTHLRGRMWPAGEAEPDTWIVDLLDDTPELQGTAGSFAVDLYNYAGTGSAYIDDLVIDRIAPR